MKLRYACDPYVLGTVRGGKSAGLVRAWAARQHLAAGAIAKENQELVDDLYVRSMAHAPVGGNIREEESGLINHVEGRVNSERLSTASAGSLNTRSNGPCPFQEFRLCEKTAHGFL